MSPEAKSVAEDDSLAQAPLLEYLTQMPPCVGQIPIRSSVPSPSISPVVIRVAGEASLIQAPVAESRY
jgi:hypothetical protein